MALPDKPLNRHKGMKTMHNRYPGVYSAMRCYGFSSSTIIKLFTDALHGDQYAMKIIRIAISATRPRN